MYKPSSLREHLTRANPALHQNPENLLVFVDEGSVRSTATASLSFEYAYCLNIIITDYAGEEDAIMVPILAWIKVHQNDLLDGGELQKKGFTFEVDFNNSETIDLSIKLHLTERVIVRSGEQGRLDIQHAREPQPTPPYSDPFWTLYAGDALLAEWDTPSAT
jgi:tail completion protein R (GpR)